MEIVPVLPNEKAPYNSFIRTHYPPVGAFMQTWEWGIFQETLGRKIERYFLKIDGQLVAAFTIAHHSLPFDLSYVYAPRGPVFSGEIGEREYAEILNHIGQWAREKFPKAIFARLEPPAKSLPPQLTAGKFLVPPYYIQPRFNLAVPLGGAPSEIVAGFHPSTRSNLARAERRGVSVKMAESFREPLEQFLVMTGDTIKRNSGKNTYPSPAYFQSLFETIPILQDKNDPDNLAVGIFCGYRDTEPAATNFVLFFGDTATYLYGASYSKHLNSKVTTYLHWSAMLEAQRRGMKYYDIGGIDEARWPSLTNFKRQFKGEEFSYLGNVDISIRPRLHGLYNLIHKFKKT